MLGRTSNQPGWLERCNVLVLSCIGKLLTFMTEKVKLYSPWVLNTDHQSPGQGATRQRDAGITQQAGKHQSRGGEVRIPPAVQDQLVSALYQAIRSMQTVKMQAGASSVTVR